MKNHNNIVKPLNEAKESNSNAKIWSSYKTLRESKEFAELVYRVIPSAIFTVDENKIITSWNKKAEQITGYTAAEMLGKYCCEFAEAPCNTSCGLYNPDVPKPINGRECVIRHKSGHMISILKNVDLIKDAKGNVIGGIESFEDISNRIEIERKLHESRERYSTLVQKMPDMILIHKEGEILFVNKAAEKGIELSASELIGTSIFSYLTEESRPLVLDVMKQRQSGEKSIQDYEASVKSRSGKIIDLLIKTEHILFDNDEAVLSILIDITERKKMESALLESEAKFKAIYNGSNDAIMLLNEQGFFECNQRTIEIFGVDSKEEFCKFHPAQLSPTVQANGHKSMMEAEKHIKTAMINGNDRFEWIHMRKNGDDFPAEVLLSAFDYHGERVLQATVRDISQRKQQEMDLLERELKLKAITGSAQDAIIMINHKGLISFWNKAATKIFGYDEEEIMGKNLHILMAPLRFHNAHNSAFADFIKNGEGGAIGKTVELMAIKKNGEEINIELSLSSIQISGHWNAIGIVRDVTEKIKSFELLKLAKEEAERANRAKSEFMAIMSHEIRTPMNGVIGMTELTLTTQLSKTQREYLESVQTSAYTLLDTINDILDFSKIEAGKLSLENAEFNLRELIERSVEILNVKAFIKNIELLFEIDPALPDFFIGDIVRIRQILMNLIGNAIKFTEKGEICVSAVISENNLAEDGQILVRLSVRDTGIGIPGNKLTKIFLGFEQADSSTTRKYGGTGLGLSISKSLSELMNGKIWVESIENIGSTFIVEIPLAISKGKVLKKTENINEIKNVLVVDDNGTNLRIMHDMLKHWGIESTLVSDGISALNMLKKSNEEKKSFDLVILDMHMPYMDGITVAEKIRNELQLEMNPMILMFSSIEKDNIKELGKIAGIDRYLTKPVKMNDFHEILLAIKNKTEENDLPEDVKIKENIKKYYGKTILIVEDNSMNLLLMNSLLAKCGANILKALNGEEAVKSCGENSIDLVFMDVHMPVMDGFEATKNIRLAEGETKHTPIIALTAIAMQGDLEKCLKSGMDDYLSKPFRSDDLFALLEKYLKDDSMKMSENIQHEDADSIDELKVFDKSEFQKLIGNNKELYTELVFHFKNLFPEHSEKLLLAISEAKYSQIEFRAHTIKGMSGNIKAFTIRKLSEKIENLAVKKSSISEINPLYEQMQKEFEKLLSEID